MITMPPASEALYFDGAPVAHIVDYQERKRLAKIARNNRDALRDRERLSLRYGAAR